MAKWTELKSGDRVVWERTDGAKFLGTVRGVSLHEVDVELDSSLFGLLENGSSELRRSIDARQLSLAIHGEPAMQQHVESLCTPISYSHYKERPFGDRTAAIVPCFTFR